MSLDPVLRAVLACPLDKGALLHLADEASLYNPRLRLLYRIRSGVPVLLADEAVEVSDAEHDRLTRRADRHEAAWTGPGVTAPM